MKVILSQKNKEHVLLCYMSPSNDSMINIYNPLMFAVFVLVPAEDSVLTVWNSSLPLEVRDLIRHCGLRDKITSKMRETLHN